MRCGSLCVSIPTLGGPFDWDKHLQGEKQRFFNDLAEHTRIANEYRLSKGKGKLPPTPHVVLMRSLAPMTDEEPGRQVEYPGRVVDVD